jgi:hypothetical protein
MTYLRLNTACGEGYIGNLDSKRGTLTFLIPYEPIAIMPINEFFSYFCTEERPREEVIAEYQQKQRTN